ncbi:WG repeat-containing protein [Flammeovirga yaeyamensis]|uniref:WG repeat-containing protein n=1 Tax=Flammeovirga yaeyamensis TaxID=367791 RepID=A0AAX1N4I2_9BACT|nr:WG repeat-containing protein [Flammeovirga yaeyamensis]MBB3700387.1 hypothetical protein [Flammeovirga yaeyamensis]NMF36987.1 WG repeat-containing protein [Flammeovirga yaeyamensis]QWG02469.1 WG repeat-containing protein [Flammeovirga yaeyamensis]
MHKKILTILLIFLSGQLFAQNARSFWKLSNKGEYEKIYKKLIKENGELDESASLNYVWGLYYIQNKEVYNLDTAYKFLQTADTLWRNANDDLKEEFIKQYVNNDSIKTWITYVEATAYKQANSQNTEEAFVTYVQKYPHSLILPQAIHKRDSLGFENAKRTHTYESYELFLRSYPDAKQAAVALERYEKLVFQHKTKDANEKSLRLFLMEHPNSPYKEEVERDLYWILTKNKSKVAYEYFIRDFPSSKLASSAIFQLFLMSDDKKSVLETYADWGQNDYYSKLLQDKDYTKIPVAIDSNVGFINTYGALKISAKYKEADATYNCHGTNELFLLLSDSTGKRGLIDRFEKVMIPFQYDQVEFISKGIYTVTSNNKVGLYCLGEGEWVPPTYDQIIQLSRRLYGVRIKNRWGIISSDGTLKFPIEAGQLIQLSENRMLVMEKGRWAMYSEDDVFEGKIKSTSEDFVYNSYKIIDDSWFLLKQYQKWSLYTPNGEKYSDAYDEVKDVKKHNFWWVRNDSIYAMLNYQNQIVVDSLNYPYEYEKGFISKDSAEWKSYNWVGDSLFRTTADTMYFNGNTADIVYEVNKETFVRFTTGTVCALDKYNEWNVTYVPQDSVEVPFIVAKSKKNGKYALLNEKGHQVMTPQFSSMRIVENAVVAKYGNLMYLYNLEGKRILSQGFDAIEGDGNELSLRLKKKFGYYNTRNQHQIAPMFDEAIVATTLRKKGVALWLGQKGGKKGLFDINNVKKASFYYDDMQLLQLDSSKVFVLEDEQWKLLDVSKNDIQMTCEKYQIIEKDKDSFWLKYKKGDKYGAYHSLYGDIIYPEFEEIDNIGTLKAPIFKVQQYINQARLHIVMYINTKGEVIFTSMLNEEGYNKIKCQ